MRDEKPPAIPTSGQAHAKMGALAMVSILAVLLTVGCQKKSQSVLAMEEGITPSDPQVATNLENLTGLLRHSMHQHHMTGKFDDFVAATQVEVPPPPTGEKYAISKTWKVILVQANAK
jgi:hypothetical protein